MRHLVLKTAILVALAAPASGSWTQAPLVHVILRDDAPGTSRQFVDAIAQAGGHASVVISERTALVRATPSILDDARLAPWIARVDADAIASRAAAASPVVERSTRVWNALLEMRAARREAPLHPDHSQGWLADARHVPVDLPTMPDLRDAPTHIPYNAEYYDTSTYLAGTTAVGVWLLEASGAVYDWSQAEEDQTLAGVVSGLDWWVTHGGAMASLTFVLEVHTDIPVSGVPILNPQSSESTWIGEALTNAGWSGANAFEQCFAYNNSIRNTYETNWAYSYFIVDSDPAVNQGLFSTGGYAWAYYGGPWVWMSRYSSWAFNAANYYEAVTEHEMGHIFYATDEYDGIQQFSGYMNWNDNPSSSVICLMNQNIEDRLCTPTRRQVGWLDTDLNGIMAPLDVPPSADVFELLPDPTSNPTPTWTGRALVNTITNLNPNDWRYSPKHDITIATIDSVECRVDGGAWSAATPTDGIYDAYGEDFSWTSPPLANGAHTVEARAHTTAGVWTAVLDSDTITVTDSPVATPVIAATADFLRVLPNPSRGEVEFAWRAPTGPVSISVFDAAGRAVFTKDAATAEGRAHWDGRDHRGRSVAAGVYLVRLTAGATTRNERIVLLR